MKAAQVLTYIIILLVPPLPEVFILNMHGALRSRETQQPDKSSHRDEELSTLRQSSAHYPHKSFRIRHPHAKAMSIPKANRCKSRHLGKVWTCPPNPTKSIPYGQVLTCPKKNMRPRRGHPCGKNLINLNNEHSVSACKNLSFFATTLYLCG